MFAFRGTGIKICSWVRTPIRPALEERLRVGRVLELVIVLIRLAGEVAEGGVYLAVGQPAFALLSAGVQVGEASAIPLAFPAVTVPFFPNEARSFANPSIVV